MFERLKKEDKEWLEKVSGIDSPLLDGAVTSISSLGSVYLALLFVILTYSTGAVALSFEAAIGLLLTWGIGYSTKHIIKRPRPAESSRSAVTYSFPSGHTATACFLATLYSFALPSIAPLLHCLALVVGLSRVYLRLHYPSDAVAGGMLGVLTAMATIMVV